MRWITTGAVSLLLLLMAVVPVAAVEVRVTELRTVGPTVRASVDLRDVLSDKFIALLDAGESLHVRIEAELWEDRPLWDKLVRPAIVSAFRIVREPNAQITVLDPFGVVASLPDRATPVPFRVEVAPSNALSDSAKYYLRLIATVGTIETKEAEDTSEAVFGRDDSTLSVARVGKLIFDTVVQVADYMQSVTAEARTGVFSGSAAKVGIRNP